MGKKLKQYEAYYTQQMDNMNNTDFYRRKLLKVLQSRYRWENLLPGCTSRYIETSLIAGGCLVFTEVKGIFMILKASVNEMNAYGEPLSFNVFSENGLICDTISADDCVVIYNSIDHSGSMYDVNYYVNKLANVDNTYKSNLFQLRHPYIISCGENQKTTLEAFMGQVEVNRPWIAVTDRFKNDINIDVLNTEVKNHTKELLEIRSIIWAECLTHFGINNINIQKKERLTVNETEENNEIINIHKNDYFEPRLKACQEINKKFGYNIAVYDCDVLTELE